MLDVWRKWWRDSLRWTAPFVCHAWVWPFGSFAIAARGFANPVIGRCLNGEQVKLGCGGRSMSFGAVELFVPDPVHRLDAGEEDARAAKGLEPHHRLRDLLDGLVVLLDDVVEVLRPAQPDVCAGVSAHSLDGRLVGAALVAGDRLRHAVQFDGALEEAPRRREASVSPKQKVDRGTGTVDGSVQVLAVDALPLSALDAD